LTHGLFLFYWDRRDPLPRPHTGFAGKRDVPFFITVDVLRLGEKRYSPANARAWRSRVLPAAAHGRRDKGSVYFLMVFSFGPLKNDSLLRSCKKGTHILHP
jgi:hypothetical protein